jgi:hypothetical protein
MLKIQDMECLLRKVAGSEQSEPRREAMRVAYSKGTTQSF